MNIHTQNSARRTLLHTAIAERQTTHVAALLVLNADPNAQDLWGYTPLHEAAFWGDTDVIRQLLSAGADPAICVQNGPHAGALPLAIAQHWKRQEVAALLVSLSPPGEKLAVERLTISRAGCSTLLDLSASKLPQKARLDFRTAYQEPLGLIKGDQVWSGYGLPMAEAGLESLVGKHHPEILQFCRDRNLPNAQEDVVPRCICCGSRNGIIIYRRVNSSGHGAPVSLDIIWQCEVYCYECSWYSYWDYFV